jgi:hypothetical protein
LPSAERVAVALRRSEAGWVADVTVRDRTTTTHRVRVSSAEHERYGGGDVAELVRRSFDFMLAREPNTSILRDFELSTIERYFPDYPTQIRRG